MAIKLKKKTGTALLEFTLILPILMLILVGIVEVSILFYNKAIITNASREGARYGIVYRGTGYATAAQITDYVKGYTSNYLITFSTTPTEVSVTATPSTPSPQFGDKLTVTVSYTYTDLVLHNFISHGQQYDISATSVMTYE
jgi:Flp pilus assembly protein TadG